MTGIRKKKKYDVQNAEMLNGSKGALACLQKSYSLKLQIGVMYRHFEQKQPLSLLTRTTKPIVFNGGRCYQLPRILREVVKHNRGDLFENKQKTDYISPN